MNIIKHIPNSITSSHLLCGCVGLIKAFEGDLKTASYLIFLALIFDFLDGFVARMLKVASPMGKELDSLADVVTFGVLPGVILLKLSTLSPIFFLNGDNFIFSSIEWYDYFCFIVTIFSALRLAKFNIDTRQSYGFIGLPTPACGILIASLPFIYTDISLSSISFIYLKYFPFILSFIMSMLLVSEIPLIALKFKNYSLKDNLFKYIFLLISVFLIVFLKFIAIPIIILLYFVVSFLEKGTNKQSI